MTTTNHLIINGPYHVPTRHLKYIREIRKFEIVEGRRPASYVIASESSKSFDDPGITVELPRVNQIRQKVDAWRADKYPGVSSITKMLLEHWKNHVERELKFFFCQMEAIETLIWLVEGPEERRQGIIIPNDGSAFERTCNTCKVPKSRQQAGIW
jgi:type III restriction enzyme